MTDNRNTILAVILSGLVLIGWQYFFNIPQMEKQRAAQQAQQAQSELAKPATPAASPATPAPQSGAAPDAVGQYARGQSAAGRRGSARRQPRRRDCRKPRASRSTPRASPAASR